MGSEFPFDEMMLGPRYILLGKQHALFDSPKLHLLGYSIVRLPLAGNRVQSDIVNTSSRTRPVIHYVDKSHGGNTNLAIFAGDRDGTA